MQFSGCHNQVIAAVNYFVSNCISKKLLFAINIALHLLYHVPNKGELSVGAHVPNRYMREVMFPVILVYR